MICGWSSYLTVSSKRLTGTCVCGSFLLVVMWDPAFSLGVPKSPKDSIWVSSLAYPTFPREESAVVLPGLSGPKPQFRLVRGERVKVQGLSIGAPI